MVSKKTQDNFDSKKNSQYKFITKREVVRYEKEYTKEQIIDALKIKFGI